jgi:hypothetical protein
MSFQARAARLVPVEALGDLLVEIENDPEATRGTADESALPDRHRQPSMEKYLEFQRRSRERAARPVSVTQVVIARTYTDA